LIDREFVVVGFRGASEIGLSDMERNAILNCYMNYLDFSGTVKKSKDSNSSWSGFTRYERYKYTVTDRTPKSPGAVVAVSESIGMNERSIRSGGLGIIATGIMLRSLEHWSERRLYGYRKHDVFAPYSHFVMRLQAFHLTA
jgi:hypothetical protein